MSKGFDWDGVDPKSFSSSERDLLDRYGTFYRWMMNRKEEITNAEREHFVRVCETALSASDFVQPLTDHEKVWRRYLILRNVAQGHARNNRQKTRPVPANRKASKPDTHGKKKSAKSERPITKEKLKRKPSVKARKPRNTPARQQKIEDTTKYRSVGPCYNPP